MRVGAAWRAHQLMRGESTELQEGDHPWRTNRGASGSGSGTPVVTLKAASATPIHILRAWLHKHPHVSGHRAVFAGREMCPPW